MFLISHPSRSYLMSKYAFAWHLEIIVFKAFAYDVSILKTTRPRKNRRNLKIISKVEKFPKNSKRTAKNKRNMNRGMQKYLFSLKKIKITKKDFKMSKANCNFDSWKILESWPSFQKNRPLTNFYMSQVFWTASSDKKHRWAKLENIGGSVQEPKFYRKYLLLFK